jgi:hypothetical protein
MDLLDDIIREFIPARRRHYVGAGDLDEILSCPKS